MANEYKKAQFTFTSLMFGTPKDEQPVYSSGVKVLGAGLGRTGTSSLKKSLEILFGGPCYHMSIVIENDTVNFWRDMQLKKATDDEIRIHFKSFASTTDNPACFHWEELLAVYPSAKVVLSVRDSDGWYKSCTETIFNILPSYPHMPFGIRVVQYILPFWRRWSKMFDVNFSHLFNGDFSQSNVKEAFENWTESVVTKCPKEKLLVFDVKQGWEPLCTFLDLPIPDVPFPHVNDTNSMKTIINGLNGLGYAIIATGVALVALIIHTPKRL